MLAFYFRFVYSIKKQEGVDSMFQPQNIILKEIEDIYDELTPVEKILLTIF